MAVRSALHPLNQKGQNKGRDLNWHFQILFMLTKFSKTAKFQCDAFFFLSDYFTRKICVKKQRNVVLSYGDDYTETNGL